MAGSRPSCSSAISAASRRWWWRWLRCPCRACRPARPALGLDPRVEGDHRGHSFSAAATSAINARLDWGLAQFARRRLDEACPYLIVDARYKWVREGAVSRRQAVLLAIGIGWDGRRSIVAVELANRERRSSWRDFLLGLREYGLSGVEFVVSDDHGGLRQAIIEVLPPRRSPPTTKVGAGTQARLARCYVCASSGSCSTIGATSPRRGVIWQPGSPGGRRPTPTSAPG